MAAAPIEAQARVRRAVRGHVLLGGARGRPVAGLWVVLHRVTTASGAPMDSLRTDGAGAFTFHVTAGDTTALYLASARYDDIVYFSEPVRVTTGDILLEPILVYHTSPTGSPIGVSQRLLTVARAKADGSRDVLELIQLLNPGPATRVAADTVRPTWQGVLPAGGPSVQRLDVTEVEGRRFARYALHAVPAGTAVAIQLGAPRFDPARLVPVIVAVLVVMLGGGLYVAFRSRQPSAISKFLR